MAVKVAVIVDSGMAPKFGIDAIQRLADLDEIAVFSCLNTKFRRRVLRHVAYYALRITTRNKWTRPVSVRELGGRVSEFVEFTSDYSGNWQVLSSDIVKQLARFDIVIKLGMGLLRVPTRNELKTPILSWHHGDPDFYRGRPAGFWEIVHRHPIMGQIIQVLSNKLDSGRVVAFAETRVHRHSYRKTLIESYRHSPQLLTEAIRNTLAGSALPKQSAGKNYRLPSNVQVLLFGARMAWDLSKHLAYGALVEKAWRVSTATLERPAAAAVAAGAPLPAPEEWQTLATPREYVFFADPFFSREPRGLLVEALSRATSRGEIVLVTAGGHRRLSSESSHLSYPSTVQIDGKQLIVPEMVEAGEQRYFRIRDGQLEHAGTLDVEGRPRIADPTLIEHEGRWYLFGNDADESGIMLLLWWAETLHSRFRLHSLSPIKISPNGGRMGGKLLRTSGRLIRFGQSFLSGYGDGVVAFEITRLTPTEYREEPIRAIRFHDRKGPHTVNFDGEHIVFDWYRERLSVLAGFRRTVARASLRSPNSPNRHVGAKA
jgi:hypothetical protein